MKPKSKKDKYTVECENKEQTIKVLNYIDSDNNKSWSFWKYVTRYGDKFSDISVYKTNSFDFESVGYVHQELRDIEVLNI